MKLMAEKVIINTPTTTESGSFYVDFTTESQSASEIALAYRISETLGKGYIFSQFRGYRETRNKKKNAMGLSVLTSLDG